MITTKNRKTDEATKLVIGIINEYYNTTSDGIGTIDVFMPTSYPAHIILAIAPSDTPARHPVAILHIKGSKVLFRFQARLGVIVIDVHDPDFFQALAELTREAVKETGISQYRDTGF